MLYFLLLLDLAAHLPPTATIALSAGIIVVTGSPLDILERLAVTLLLCGLQKGVDIVAAAHAEGRAVLSFGLERERHVNELTCALR